MSKTGQAASAQLLCLKGHCHATFLGGYSPSPSPGYLYAINDQTRVLLCLSLLGHRSFSLLPWCGLHSPRPSCSCKGEADHGCRVSTAVMEGLAEHFLGSSPGPNAFYPYLNSYEGQLIICANTRKDHRSFLPSPFLFSARHPPSQGPRRARPSALQRLSPRSRPLLVSQEEQSCGRVLLTDPSPVEY